MVEIVSSINTTQFVIMGVVYLFTLGYSIYMAFLNRKQANVNKLMKANNEKLDVIIDIMKTKQR